MTVIVHSIRLHAGVSPERFEAWVKESDYATCPALPSVRAFRVFAASRDPAAAFHFVEVIEVSSRAAFEADMRTLQFRKLVNAFEQMASVVTELSGELVPPGYRALT